MNTLPEGYFSNIFIASVISSYLLKKFNFLDIILWGSVMAYSDKTELINLGPSPNPIHYIDDLAKRSGLSFPVSPDTQTLDFTERPVHNYCFYYYAKKFSGRQKICGYEIRAEDIQSVSESNDKTAFFFWLKQGEENSYLSIRNKEPFLELHLSRDSEYSAKNPYYREYSSRLSEPPIF